MIIALQTLLFFRETLIRVLDAYLRPYYKNFSLTFSNQNDSDDEESEDQVYAEYHDEKGVVFFPPVYVQRYAAVTDCLMDEKWCGKLEKVVDFGYHDLSFIKYLKDVPGINHILGVDIEASPLQSASDIFASENFTSKRESPLKLTLFQGNAADPDYRLIGCDAVVAIEMIEHMLPQDLDRFIHTIFGFIKPWVAIITTPNGDFNVLFKSLEKNGLRRLAHFFEWSREQFHDWCSNIVLRYPQYTVSCKGIGPGPPDTEHLGCCSQMAIFVAKDYHKQQNLDLNSLALVASKDIASVSMDDMSSSYECIPENNMLCLTNEPDFTPEMTPNDPSCLTIVLQSSVNSYQDIEYTDNEVQCNLGTELAKGFLFDSEITSELVPRRKRLNRIYEIENVTNRLNCSTMQVKKFSKATQNVMARNKIDSLVHTREVVDEIRHLTKMLNFNKNSNQDGGDHLWNNINWGDNAPYWNQYYKIVKDYSYPAEHKTDECRILDLISEEINNLVDQQWDEEFPVEMSKLEIPLHQLMPAVAHITDDVDRVRELLEWNGYQIVDDLVIHSRLVVDNTSVGTRDDDWPDDTLSDWDTSDLHSVSLSEGSTNAPDYYGRCIRKALDHKVKKLRSLISADEDITSELDRVVCRLMKLALHTSLSRQSPVPASWVQFKLFDLLTLTEKAIERRRKHYLEEFTLRVLENGKYENNCILALEDVKKDTEMTDKIMYKYRHLVNPLERIQDKDPLDNSNYFDDFEYNTESNQDKDASDLAKGIEIINKTNEDLNIDKISHWVGLEREPEPLYYNDEMVVQKPHVDETTATNTSVDPVVKRHEISSPSFDSADETRKIRNYVCNPKTSDTKISKKPSRRKLSYTFLMKNYYIKLGSSDCKNKNKTKLHRKHEPKAAAPIPSSIIDLCNSPEKQNGEVMGLKDQFCPNVCNEDMSLHGNNSKKDISATENSCIISIISQDKEELVALRRSIGTDPEFDFIDQEAAIETVINVTKQDSLKVLKEECNEDVHSQTIFLYDINEPSTSKGVRHVRLDVQCGPDDDQHYPTLSTTTSFTMFPKMFSKGLEIEQSKTNLFMTKETYDIGTSPESAMRSRSPYRNYYNTGIWINDSDTIIREPKKNVTTILNNDAFFDKTGAEAKAEIALEAPAPVLEDENTTLLTCNKVHSKNATDLATTTKTNLSIEMFSSKSDEQPKSPTRQGSKLSCGGIHVHSFKDKEVCQDVIYQGGWNEINTNLLVRKTTRKPVPKKTFYTPKKLKRSSNTSVKNQCIKNEIAHSARKPVQKKYPKSQNVLKKEQVNKNLSSKKPVNPVKNRNFRLNKNINKVPSKIVISAPKKTSNCGRENPKLSPRAKSFEKPSIENYLPAYLKRNRSPVPQSQYLSTSIDSAKPNIKNPPMFIISNTTDDKANILQQVKQIPNVIVSYQVFRNEVEKITSVDQNIIGTNSTPRRSYSPGSQYSSDSSPNSIGTVRAVTSPINVESIRNCSTSSNIETANPLGFKTNITSKIKNVLKRNKNDKKSEDKENNPTCKGCKIKKGFNVTPKNIFRAHMNTENSALRSVPIQSKSKAQLKKSTVKLPNIQSSSRLILKSSTSSLSKTVKNSEGNSKHAPSFTSIALESQQNDNVIDINKEPPPPDMQDDIREIYALNNEIVNLNSSNPASVKNCVKAILEEQLTSICDTPRNSPQILGNDEPHEHEFENSSFNTSLSPMSTNTVIENKHSSNFKLELEEAIKNLCIEVASNSTIVLSDTRTSDLKSIESICSSSKVSEYFLADSQNANEFLSINNETSSSIQGIFERTDHNIATKVHAPIACQAFSGFSINSTQLSGDQSHYVHLVDPETGILQPANRQAESEEILVSGRSSDTYESCFVEDDSFVPSWLFNIISQQQSADESEDEANTVPLTLPIVEPVFDVNGDILENIGAGAGAGDGRGMHSDQSHDSSGRGTSLSSSTTSTDSPNEAILIDPSAFTAQYEYLRDNNSSNLDRPESPDTSFTTAEADNGDDNRHRRNRLAGSDIDADVSSLDTDIADSDA